MKNNIIYLLLLFIIYLFFPCSSISKNKEKVDICIYGGTSAGVISAYTAKQMGKNVILVEPGNHLGGMSSGGLGFTDIGNKYVVKGLALDFYRRIGKHYGKLEQWIFEPKVAENVFNEYIQKANVNVLLNYRIVSVNKNENLLCSIKLECSSNSSAEKIEIEAKQFIDCSYEGDLMAKAGVSYTYGRESNSMYSETYNGVELMKGHQLPDGIDPYIIKGNPQSGLLFGIHNTPKLPDGTGDKKIQAYNYRITLTNVPKNKITISKPDNYNPENYELLLRMKEISPWKELSDIFIWNMMPNGKTDINNRGGFSTDLIGMNWEYPESSYQKRKEIIKLHEDFTKGLLYFLGNDSRIPYKIRFEMQHWGYPKDEYSDNKHFTPQLYIRECRRMLGETVMTQHHCQGKEVVSDGIGWAAYTMDSHNCDRQIVNGMAKNEGNVEIGGFGPYPISYHCLTPKRTEAVNLLVPVCLSASHIAYGSIRMEPVFMLLAQDAAIASCLAIDENKTVQDIDYRDIIKLFHSNPLMDGSIPDIWVDNRDSNVMISGKWESNFSGGYGKDFLSIANDSKNVGFVKYKPDIKKEHLYSVYIYFPKIKDISSKVQWTVFDGKKETNILLKDKKIQVAGQTSGEWVSLGSFQLMPGTSYIEVSNKNVDGKVTADAVLLIAH